MAKFSKIKHLLSLRMTWIAITAILVLAILHVLVAGTYVFFKTRKMYPKHQMSRANTLTLESITPWMTFDYINKIFGLPDDYLREGLNVTDNRYPKIKLETLAKQEKQNNQELIQDIQAKIRDYYNL